MTIRPRRSVLYMPGSNARALEKAKSLPADCLILDLEDAVAPDAKPLAREQVVAAVKGGGYGSRELIIRINSLATPWGPDDLKAAAGAGAQAILIPKVQTRHDLEAAREALWRADAPAGLDLWAMIETPLAILNIGEIAADAANARHPLATFVMGTNDLAKETRAALGGDRLPMITWLSITIAAGRAYGVDIIDGVFNAIGDEAGFGAECAQGRRLGMDGKTLIHPSQIGPCNEAFSPGAEEIAWARKVIDAFALPGNQGKGAISLEGRMVELLHAQMARRTVAIAEAIAALSAPPAA